MHLMRKSLLAVGLILLVCGSSVAWDWPQWHGQNRDAKSDETGLLKKWPAGGPKEVWSVSGIGAGYSQAVITGGRIYITGVSDKQGTVSAFDLDGKLLWRKPYGPDGGPWDRRFPGARTTPTVHDGRLYVLSSNERISCFDLDGKALWQVDLRQRFGARLQRWGNAESVLIDGENVICTPGGNKAMLAALSRKTGETVWTTAGLPGLSSYCSPALIERGRTRLIVTMTSAHIIGVEAGSGRLLWKRAYRNKYGNHPVTPTYNDGLLYLTSGYNLGGVMLELSADGRSFTERWAEKRPDPTHGGVIHLDGHIYGSAQSRSGRWFCVELKTGAVKWGQPIVKNGCAVYADGLFYCYGERGNLALVEMSPKAPRVVSRFRITKGRGKHWAHPSISNGRLYVRHGDVLMAYDIKAKAEN